ITSSEFTVAKSNRDLELKPGKRFIRIREPYFFSYVEELLQQEYGSNTVREGGLRVYTPINPGLPAAAVVSIDPRNGYIKAMAAVSPGRKRNQFNFVTSARRQPGSTFKTIALTAAVARGMDPFHTSYLSAPLHYQPDSTCNPLDPNCAWDVATYDHSYRGVESVASATVQSDNSVF